MGRQLFLHHYLPAHLASTLVTGALVEFIFNIEPTNLGSFAEHQLQLAKNGSKQTQAEQGLASNKPIRERIAGQSLLATWAASGVIVAFVIASFIYFAPLTYGSPGLTIEQVNARKWLNYDFHFAK